MIKAKRPSYRQLLGLLERLGFTIELRESNLTACRHEAAGAWFLFRYRSPDDPLREPDYVAARKQLTEWGLVTDDEFARFAADAVSLGLPTGSAATRPT